ncbi:hypothetical protein H7J07_06005 [Mycobacterium koreense]|uniref:Uncharacterized protein n=1 Tax=Mycolicibacillus koreensis TaxID=1069220 RepID=A0A7I7SB93_9MYCO|nr:hypothetical protein [Mycolicibacillus koreensis]MCV7247780.1 hypothetical protein [Mycolicibacillus koreensis]OSC34703.1 hypothetical protein B8W67_05495 [Mycolicibacillus koreensis]BBY54164.1 hypothetical protein MKOR_14150 [Mycolicibacillus koreensis]
MATVAEHQRALDLYAAAAYWLMELGGDELASRLEAQLQRRAVAAGASVEQLHDARDYARDCVLLRNRPLMAGASFEAFEREASR